MSLDEFVSNYLGWNPTYSGSEIHIDGFVRQLIFAIIGVKITEQKLRVFRI